MTPDTIVSLYAFYLERIKETRTIVDVNSLALVAKVVCGFPVDFMHQLHIAFGVLASHDVWFLLFLGRETGAHYVGIAEDD